ncbi:hypothetical protein Ae406Ps2_3391 [Pseudonocardia sp. Ae406_Ps2]|nr:hypothetical protein Ae331Ps2_2531c [Pseudonocardia sp. Ae331_Ps2]OLM03391.1 hypothetical protein Ae406Ps2_3391 [Pseudonocardia sp. Ae406_Ps2]OLM11715.1 hypothetical protein Ae505Ps2_1840c [Pseudonocardia sp. Ae505_Ps2]OLM24956.1 hypothetical protein Ae706Ps2_3389 [Pseudonocardia sp. Ae706_Ps2]OLM34808.1 hypothetical protein Ae717Ps2_5704c [Pseudonocardia sp. Ae717_Ps2]
MVVVSTPLDHEWRTASRHRTSDGVVSYQRCRCGAWRIRLAAPGTATVAASAGRDRALR